MFQGLHCPFATSAHQPATAYSSISPPPHSFAGHNCLTALCLRYMPLHSLHYASGLRYIRSSFHYDPFAPLRSFSSTNLGNPRKRSSFTTFRSVTTLSFPLAIQWYALPCVYTSMTFIRYLYISKKQKKAKVGGLPTSLSIVVSRSSPSGFAIFFYLFTDYIQRYKKISQKP